MYRNLLTVKDKQLPVLSLLLTFLMLGWVSVGWGQGQVTLYWGGSGIWTDSVWSTTGAAPYSSPWISGSSAVFNVANSTITGAKTAFASITATENVTVTPNATIGTGGAIAKINIASGKTFDFGSQKISSAAGTGLIKDGAGSLALSAGGNSYPGGFTLNDGVVIIQGVATFGSGTLTINKKGSTSTIAANSNTVFTAGRPSAIVIGGDFTLGANITGFASSSANISFDATTAISLGNSVSRTITLGGTGIYTFNGAISGTSSNLSVAANANGTLVLGGSNTYSGLTTISGGTLKLAHTGGGALPATSNITINNGTLKVSSNQVLNNLTLSSGTLTIDTGDTLTINGAYNATGGTIVNNGTLIINSTSASFPGTGVIVNNGTVNTLNSLQVGALSTVSLTNSFAVTGNLIDNGIIIPVSTAIISGSGTLTGTGTAQVTAAGNAAGDFTAQYTIANKTLTNLTVEFAGAAAQNIAANTFGGLKISNTNDVTMKGNVMVSNTLSLNTGTLLVTDKTLTIKGGIGVNTGNSNISASAGTIVFSSTAAQNIPAATFVGNDVANLTLNNSNGVTTSSDLLVGTLTLTNGVFNIGSKTLSITAIASGGSGTINAANGTIAFTGPTGISIPTGTFTGDIKNLTLNKTGTTGGDSTVIINNDITVVNTLKLTRGALDINGKTLTLSGTVVNGTGTLTGSSTSSLIISGNAGTLNFTDNAKTLKDFTIKQGAVAELGTLLAITGGTTPGTLKVNGALTTNGRLRLQSNSGGTASVGPSLGTITGNATVERYIPARRAFRFLTAPLSNAGSVFSQWQNNGSPSGNTGVEIWRPGGTGAGINGDGMTNGGASPSIQHYDSSISKFANITNTKIALLGKDDGAANNTDADNLPYAVFVTGPYGNSSVITGNPIATTLSAAGKLQLGTQSFTYGSNLNAGNYIMMANPYASAVNFLTITKNNLNNTFWAWDPNLSTRGAYVVVSYDNANHVTIVPRSGTSTAQTQNIENGQAVLVRVTAANTTTSVTFQEADKVTSGASVFRQENNAKGSAAVQELRVTLNRKDAASGLYNYADELAALFSKVYSTTTSDDANKVYGYDENMSLVQSNVYFTISRRPLVKVGDTLFMNIDYLKQNTDYQFKMTPQDFAGVNVTAYLVDKYLNKQTAISLTTDSAKVGFTTTSDTGSYSAARFMIVFKPAAITAKVSTAAAVIKVADSKSVFTIYPNPVADNTISVYLNNISAGNYNLMLYDNVGKQIIKRGIVIDNASGISCSLQLPAGTASGAYVLVLKNKDGKQWQQQVVIQH